MAQQRVIITHGPGQTQELGKRIGQHLRAPTVITLHGDLGSGKTVFVQGLAQGLEVPATCYVTSPSYTLVNEYPGRLPLYHIDLYRLGGSADVEDIGLFEILDGNGVAAIEWAERLEEPIDGGHLEIRIDALDAQKRRFTLTAYGLDASNLIMSLGYSEGGD